MVFTRRQKGKKSEKHKRTVIKGYLIYKWNCRSCFLFWFDGLKIFSSRLPIMKKKVSTELIEVMNQARFALQSHSFLHCCVKI